MDLIFSQTVNVRICVYVLNYIASSCSIFLQNKFEKNKCCDIQQMAIDWLTSIIN